MIDSASQPSASQSIFVFDQRVFVLDQGVFIFNERVFVFDEGVLGLRSSVLGSSFLKHPCKGVVVEIPVTGIYVAVQLCKQHPHLVDGPFSCWLDKPSRQAIKHQYFMTFRENSKEEPVLTATWVAGHENNVLLHQGCLALQNFLSWFSPYYPLKTFPSKIFHLLALQCTFFRYTSRYPSIVKFVRYFCAD